MISNMISKGNVQKTPESEPTENNTRNRVTEALVNNNAIEEISKIEMGQGQLADAVLVTLGLKPSTELYIYKWNEDAGSIKAKLKNAGLTVKEKKIREDEKGKLVARYIIALDEVVADKLMKVNSEEEPEQYGLLMGYPKTAVDAFMGKRPLLSEEDYPDMNGIIFTFRMSKDHYKEEFKVLQNWSEAMKEYVPELYRELNEGQETFKNEQTLEQIKKEIDEGVLEGKEWSEIRQKYGIPLNKINDKGLILDILGADTLIKYFTALSGEGRPYKFPLPLQAGDLSEYLDYELAEAPAYLISDLLKKPLSKAGVNIFISHCIHIPGFTLPAIETIEEEKLNQFLTNLINKYPATAELLGKIFSKKRISLLKELSKYNADTNPAPPELIEELYNLEQTLFGSNIK